MQMPSASSTRSVQDKAGAAQSGAEGAATDGRGGSVARGEPLAAGRISAPPMGSALATDIHVVGLVDEVGATPPVAGEQLVQEIEPPAEVRRRQAVVGQVVERGPDRLADADVLPLEAGDLVGQPWGDLEDLLVQAPGRLGDLDVDTEDHLQVVENRRQALGG